MVDRTNAIKLAKQFLEDCIKGGVSITSAWMFGSYVKGNPREYSDIDLALVSDDFTRNFLDNNHKTALINFNYPDIEVHHFNRMAFMQHDPFVEEIKKTGIEIYNGKVAA
jgi:predicted nucleotidyltransferase